MTDGLCMEYVFLQACPDYITGEEAGQREQPIGKDWLVIKNSSLA